MQSKIQVNWEWNVKKSDLAVLFKTNDVLKMLLSQMKTPLDFAMVSQVCCTFYNTIGATFSFKKLYEKQNKISLCFFEGEKTTVYECRDNTLFSQIREKLKINNQYTFHIPNGSIIKDDSSPKDYNLTENSKVFYTRITAAD